MTLRLVTSVVGVVILLAAVELLRRRRLREKYAVLWLLVAVGQLALAIFPPLLDLVAGWLGVADPPNLLAFGGIVFLLGVCAHLSWESSQLEEETRTLAEEIAILREEVESLRRDRTSG
ncbi:DUF2304 domain-containing protein [Euzebya sp.]|uniref:DUF2304 domain-containing protein n=1 Tax=Euzebya sp. TaxID=1971409 RepID=UPI003512C791